VMDVMVVAVMIRWFAYCPMITETDVEVGEVVGVLEIACRMSNVLSAMLNAK
jgi:hypothetical protein